MQQDDSSLVQGHVGGGAGVAPPEAVGPDEGQQDAFLNGSGHGREEPAGSVASSAGAMERRNHGDYYGSSGAGRGGYGGDEDEDEEEEPSSFWASLFGGGGGGEGEGDGDGDRACFLGGGEMWGKVN